MDNVVRFYVTDNNEVVEEAILSKVGMDSPEKIENAFGDTLKLKEVWLNPSNGQSQLDILRKCQAWASKQALAGTGTPDDKSYIEPYARIEVMVEKWNGFKFTPTIEHALDMHPNILVHLNGLILNYMYPSINNNANFMTAWSKLQESSAQEKVAS